MVLCSTFSNLTLKILLIVLDWFPANAFICSWLFTSLGCPHDDSSLHLIDSDSKYGLIMPVKAVLLLMVSKHQQLRSNTERMSFAYSKSIDFYFTAGVNQQRTSDFFLLHLLGLWRYTGINVLSINIANSSHLNQLKRCRCLSSNKNTLQWHS